ncbi:MAG TPA: hypothetical protein VNA20_05650 [Frankiaceae bacterium]|nr:hypothetical protein [Frankiaceae bacterium]
MRRILAFAALTATAALAAPAAPASAVGACTPSLGGTTAGGCVDVVCLKLCVWRIDVDPQCSLDRPAPAPVATACSRVDQQFFSVGPG